MPETRYPSNLSQRKWAVIQALKLMRRNYSSFLWAVLLAMMCPQCGMFYGLYGRGLRTGPMIEPRPEDCAITILKKGDSLPEHALKIGEVEATDYRSGPLKNLLPELKRQACLLGGVAIARITYREYEPLRGYDGFVMRRGVSGVKRDVLVREYNRKKGTRRSIAHAAVYYSPSENASGCVRHDSLIKWLFSSCPSECCALSR